MWVLTLFQKSQSITNGTSNDVYQANSAHETQKVQISLPRNLNKQQLAFLKRGDTDTENDVELTISALNQLDGPHFAKCIGLSLEPNNKKQPRNMVASMALLDFHSYKSLIEENSNLALWVFDKKVPKEVGWLIAFLSGFYRLFCCPSSNYQIDFKNVKGLAAILLSAYRDGEDDLHRQNFGIFKDEQGESIWGRLDFGLSYAETTGLAQRPFRSNGFSQLAYSKISAKDLDNFPCISDASPFYWPTLIDSTNSFINFNRGNRYSQLDKMLFEKLAENAEFIEEKHLFMLRQLMQPLALKRQIALDNVINPEEGLKLACSIAFRQHQFIMSSLCLKAFRDYLLLAHQEYVTCDDKASSIIYKVAKDLSDSVIRLKQENHHLITKDDVDIDLFIKSLMPYIHIAKSMEDKGKNKSVEKNYLYQKGKVLLSQAISGKDKSLALLEIDGQYLAVNHQKAEQHALEAIAYAKANELMVCPYQDLLKTLEEKKPVFYSHLSDNQQKKWTEVLSLSHQVLRSFEKPIVNWPIFHGKENIKICHEAYLFESKKARQIRRFVESMFFILSEVEKVDLKGNELELIASTLTKVLLKYRNKKGEQEHPEVWLKRAQKILGFLPYELKLLKLRERFNSQKPIALPATKIKQLLAYENKDVGFLNARLFQILKKEARGNFRESNLYSLQNGMASKSYIHILECCDIFFDASLNKFCQDHKNDAKVKSFLSNAKKIEARLIDAEKYQKDSIIYDADCLISRLVLQAEILKAEFRIQNKNCPPGVSPKHYQLLIHSAKQVVYALAKPKYHEKEALGDVAKAATLVASCLNTPTLKQALYCQNQAEKLCLSKKTRLLTQIFAAMCGMCLFLAAAGLVAAGALGVITGVGFIPGILALPLVLHFVTAAISTLGLVLGCFSLFRHIRDEDFMKRQVGFFSEAALKVIEPSSTNLDDLECSYSHQ